MRVRTLLSILGSVLLILATLFVFVYALPVHATYHFADYSARPPLHVYATTGKNPVGMMPADIKRIYNLPSRGGSGVVVIVGAYNDTAIAKDLADFSTALKLPPCTIGNGCFSQHLMARGMKDSSSGWDLETALDVEWAHAIAPAAKIVLVEAATPSGTNLLKAIDYAASIPDARGISLSWGGAEFGEETTLDSHFKSVSGASFFVSSGDSGAGVSWPASSPNVISVGGTSVILGKDGALLKETAWQGSGGGVSAYEKMPPYQSSYSIPRAGGMRAVPDVSYDADPLSGFPIIHNGIWRTVGGTSAGAPQWAAIAALGSGATNADFYADKSKMNSTSYFRDIVSGKNGTCGYYCDARMRYDYVTGLGTPQTTQF